MCPIFFIKQIKKQNKQTTCAPVKNVGEHFTGDFIIAELDMTCTHVVNDVYPGRIYMPTMLGVLNLDFMSSSVKLLEHN